jgi:hypothetical protein
MTGFIVIYVVMGLGCRTIHSPHLKLNRFFDKLVPIFQPKKKKNSYPYNPSHSDSVEKRQRHRKPVPVFLFCFEELFPVTDCHGKMCTIYASIFANPAAFSRCADFLCSIPQFVIFPKNVGIFQSWSLLGAG